MVRVQISSRETGLPSYREWLTKALAGELRLEALHGDGSDRSFFRLRFPGERTPQTAILIKGVVPPFTEVNRLLHQNGLPVPTIYAEDTVRQAILEEDFGDLHLERVPTSMKPDLYREALTYIDMIQQRLTPVTEASASAPMRRVLDPWALYHELLFFMNHFLEGHLGRKLTPVREEDLKLEFKKFAETFSSLPKLACHRDYHARNLLLRTNGRLGIVDFQDTRLGPPHYDLASLLRDSYVEAPPGIEQELLDRFHVSLFRYFPNRSMKELEMIYYRTAAQRGIKALGSFGYLANVKGKTHFLEAIPRAIENVRISFERNSNLSSLRQALSAYVPEWE